MNSIEKMKVEQAEQIAKVIADNPGVPIMCLAPTPSDYDTYYYATRSACVDWILWPIDVEKMYGHTFGLNYERIYSDETDAVEDVAGWLFDGWWDHAHAHGMRYERNGEAPDDVLTKFCGYKYDYEHNVSIDRMAEVLAYELVKDLPWRKYVVIDCD